MSLLPGRFMVPSIWYLVAGLFFLLLTSYPLLGTSNLNAAPGGPPNPQPCENVQTGPLTDNWITDDKGNPPIDQDLPRTGNPGDSLSVTLNAAFTVNFSKLQAIFGATNSNYLEGRFQDQTHRDTNILSLKSADFNKFHGPGQKVTPKVMTDELRVKYVNYVYEKPELAESGNKYTDIEGKGAPKTIYDLVNQFGRPNPPEAGQSRDTWIETWGRYWEKIPTTYSEFYEGKIEFRLVAGKDLIDRVKAGNLCPLFNLRIVNFVMPEFFRTTATTGQLNQIVVPQAAQSKEANNLILKVAGGTKKTLAKILEECVRAATQNPLSHTLRKVIKVTFNHHIPQLVKNAYAQENPSCIKIIAQGKEGSAPYCALPADQLQPGDSCTNQNDSNKLDKDNPNVICTFRLTWTSPPMIIGQTRPDYPDQWDRCEDADGDPDTTELRCYLEVAIYPVIRIPWLSEIWNNTLYSNEEEGEAGAGVGTQQETGRPGVYSNFTPNAVLSSLFEESLTRERFNELKKDCKGNDPNDLSSAACQELFELLAELEQKYPNIAAQNAGSCDPIFPTRLLQCFAPYWGRIPYRNMPGEVSKGNVAGAKTSNVLGATSSDARERFVGATDCSKEYVRDVALKPKALQEALGIDKLCNLQARTGPPGPGPGPGSDGDLDYYIEYGNPLILPEDPNAIKNLANTYWPGNNIDKWDHVISESRNRGISPAFTITIWWEEGGFGGAGANSEFGCFPGGDTSQHLNFTDSFNCFLDFTAHEHPYDPARPYESFYEWVKYFCGPNAPSLCSNNPGFIDRLESVYNSVAPGEIVYVGNI